MFNCLSFVSSYVGASNDIMTFEVRKHTCVGRVDVQTLTCIRRDVASKIIMKYEFRC